MKHVLIAIVLSCTLLILGACGDGSSTHANTTATLKVSLTGNTGGKAIGGADFTVTLPANVTPATVSGTVATGVVTQSGTFAGSTIAPTVTYTPATATVPGKLRVVLASSAPAGVTTVGEAATITLHLANGAAPTTTDFSVSNANVIDTLLTPIAGMSAIVAGVTLQ